MGKKKPIVSSLGQWAYPGEVTIIPSNSITMKGVGYPVLGVDNLGNSQMMMPGADYTFPGDYVTEIPQMGKGGLTQWFAEEWTDVKTGKPCGRSGKEKGSRPYPACRPKKRVNETTPKTTSEMSSAEKARFKREKTSGKRIDYNHKRREDGGETWLDQYQDGGIKNKRKNISDSPNYQYDDKGNLLYTPSVKIEPYAADNSTRGSFSVNPKLVMQNLNPTLEEFINVASPYYPIDNKLVIDPKINLQPSKYQQYLEQEYVLPQMVGRSFGNLPLIKDDGYSPNRRWVSNLRAKDTGSKYSNDSYAYVLKTNPNNLVDYSTKNTIEDSVSSNDKVFYDYLAKNNYLPNTVSQLTKKLPDQIWNTAEQMRVEMLNNPEIMSWANLHNIDLGYKQKGQGDDSFAPKIPESVYANRLVKAGLATNRPDYDYKPMETYIVQDPSKFNLAGYFPMNSIVKDAEQKVLNKKVSDEPKQESIYFGTPEYFEKESYIKNEIAKRLGINPSAFDTGEYLIHYNQSPITEYTPGKKYGGWLEQYQEGGEEPAPEDIEKMETIEINSRVGNKQVSKRKTDLDREINTGYNIFDKLKNKANRFILNLVASNPAFAQTLIEGTKIADKAVRKVGDKTKDFIYENYRPVEYPTVFGAIHNLYKGSAPPIVNPEGKLIPGEEAYRLALGLPTEQNYIIPSKYRPTTSTDPSMSYYTMPDVFDQQALIDAYMEQSKGQPGQKVQIKALSQFIKNENKIDSPDIPFEQTDPLQNFQLSQGSDERGNYISLYDIYDFGAPFDQLIYGSNRKPIEFYDRFYYTTNAQGKPVYKKKYGGWLNKYK